MKFISEFRDAPLASHIANRLDAHADRAREYRLMEFCGGHTHAIARHGLTDLLPPNVRMIHGPGCPVCVLPIGRIDQAIELARDPSVILCTYGDTMRVPASRGHSLLQARADGAKIRVVHSPIEALQLAREHPQREIVFFAIGFETTTPATALLLQQARRLSLPNLSVLCCHVLTPPAIEHLAAHQNGALRDAATGVHGFVGPAHVSVIIGTEPYRRFAEHYRRPIVIAGFEPLDLLQSILMLVRQVNDGRAELENEFSRAVNVDGNQVAQAAIADVFEVRESFEWRGLGQVPRSALRLRDTYARWDAERRFGLGYQPVADNKACECPSILRGALTPPQCRLFGNACTPQTPIGACMVSSEGACAAFYSYGRHRSNADRP